MFVMVPLVFFINGMTKGDWLEVKRINIIVMKNLM